MKSPTIRIDAQVEHANRSQLSCPISMEIAFYKPMNQSESQCIPPGWSANAFWTPLILRIGVCYQSLSLNMVVLSPLWSVVESTLWGMQCIRCLYSTVFYWLSNINWYSLTGLQLLNSWTALWLSILRSCIRANGVQASRAFYQRLLNHLKSRKPYLSPCTVYNVHQ